jgi:hypothetical protein
MMSARTIKHATIIAAATAALSVSLSAERCASAQTAGGSGANCSMLRSGGSVAGNFLFDDSGAVNVSDAVDNATCGMIRLTTSHPRTVFVDIYDGSNASKVICTFTVRGWDTTVLYTATQSTTAAFTGITALSTVIPSSVTGYVTVNCQLPGVGSAGYSRLDGYNIQ